MKRPFLVVALASAMIAIGCLTLGLLLYTPPQPTAVAQQEITPSPRPDLAELQKQQIAEQSAAIQAILDAFTGSYPNQFGIVVTNLQTGATASVNADQQMVSASLYKLFVGYGIYKKVDGGTLKLTNLARNSTLTVNECLRIMIVVSDNDCGYSLGVMVGWTQLDADLAALGLTQTKINNYIAPNSGTINSDKLTSPADVAHFLKLLYEGKLLSQNSTEAYIDILKATELNTWLPSGLPDDAVIAHKTGALYDFVHDAGIIYSTSGNYVVVVMSQGWQNPTKQTPPVFADIAGRLWNYFNSTE